jgi:RNA polymerase sigma factor (sigma-70 family)
MTGGTEHPENPKNFLPTRGTLLSRLKDLDDSDSWRAFFNTYWKLIYGVAIKAGLSSSDAQEVVQETVIAVARRIGEFKYDPNVCSFKTWLLQVTRSRISNQFRKLNRHHAAQAVPDPESARTPLIERVPDPLGNHLDRLWDEEWEKNVMDAAISRVKRRVDAEQFQLFDFYVLKQWPVRRVTKAFGVSAGRVYLAKHRISKMVKVEIENLEAKCW